MPWHPPIPSGMLYSDAALQLGPGLAMLAWCYDNVQRDGSIEVHLNTAASDIGRPYGTIKDWWKMLRAGPFFCEQLDRGRRGWVVRLAEDWIDWHIMTNNQGRDVSLKEQASSPSEGRNISLEDRQVPVKSPSSLGEGRDVSLETAAYKEDHHDQESGGVASRKTRSQRPSQKARDPTPMAIRQSLADVCGLDLTVCSKAQHMQVNTVAKRLYLSGQKATKTPEETVDAIRYVAGYFSRNDWRGKKGERPTPTQLVDVWGAAIAARKPAPNGYSPPTEKLPDVLGRDEVLARLAQQGKKL